MAKILVCLADAQEQEKAITDLRLRKFIVSPGEPVTLEEEPKHVAQRMIEAKADLAIVDYISADAHSVKVLQSVTDSHKGPRFIFVLPEEGVEVGHILMAVNEGADAILARPLKLEALANYAERAVNGPGRFRYEAGREASTAAELAKIERLSKTMQIHMASYRKLIAYLLANPASAQHRTVLLVSDSAYQRDYLRKLFEDHGFHVDTAEKPVDGLALALETHPRIVVSDLEMEGKNGVEFCRSLKIEHKLVPCYFVICTANSEKIDSVMVPGNGVDACVLKPSNESGNLDLIANAAMGLLL